MLHLSPPHCGYCRRLTEVLCRSRRRLPAADNRDSQDRRNTLFFFSILTPLSLKHPCITQHLQCHYGEMERQTWGLHPLLSPTGLSAERWSPLMWPRLILTFITVERSHCVSMENHLIITLQHSAASRTVAGEFNLRNNICRGSWKFCTVQRGIGARAREVGAFKSALRSLGTPAFEDCQSDYCRPVNPVLSLCTVSSTV